MKNLDESIFTHKHFLSHDECEIYEHNTFEKRIYTFIGKQKNVNDFQQNINKCEFKTQKCDLTVLIILNADSQIQFGEICYEPSVGEMLIWPPQISPKFTNTVGSLLYINSQSKSITQLHWIGRFGNRMFQYAFSNCYAKNMKGHYYKPSRWEGDELFEKSDYCSIIEDDTLRLWVNQTDKRLDNRNVRERALKRYCEESNKTIKFSDSRCFLSNTDVAFDDLNCMYSLKLFKLMNTDDVKHVFRFSEKVKNTELYKKLYSIKGTYDIAHLRRGDIASPSYKGAHSMVTKQSYIKAMQTNGTDVEQVIWVSDDVKERSPFPIKINERDVYSLSKGHKWSYPTGEHEIPDIIFDFLPEFLLIVFARTIYRANSSFSWWAAFLSEAEVYSPVITSKPTDRVEKFHAMDCDFVQGNQCHFMGSKEEGFVDIEFKAV
jgi:hypothetical protein